jgi:hypothetical protein
MKRLFYLVLFSLACTTSPKPKPDPFITVRVRDLLDTTTAVGRTHWHIYALLSGPYTAQNGIATQGAIGLNDLRAGHSSAQCVKIAADSVGQRLLVVFAIGDTTTEQLTSEAKADSVVNAWYSGSRVVPAGYKALFTQPTDAWDAQQYHAGHGLIRSDPIKWGWDWSGSGTTTFYERTDNDPNCSTF